MTTLVFNILCTIQNDFTRKWYLWKVGSDTKSRQKRYELWCKIYVEVDRSWPEVLKGLDVGQGRKVALTLGQSVDVRFSPLGLSEMKVWMEFSFWWVQLSGEGQVSSSDLRDFRRGPWPVTKRITHLIRLRNGWFSWPKRKPKGLKELRKQLSDEKVLTGTTKTNLRVCCLRRSPSAFLCTKLENEGVAVVFWNYWQIFPSSTHHKITFLRHLVNYGNVLLFGLFCQLRIC